MQGTIAGLAVLVVILAGTSVYEFAFPPGRTLTSTTTTTVLSTSVMTMQGTGSCPPMSGSSGMNASMTMSSMTPIELNASMVNYKMMLEVGAPENMLLMCQVTNSTMAGEVMVAGQMSVINMSMTSNTYHLEVHIFDIKTGAVVVVPVDSVSITVTNSSGMSMSVPVAEMFGAMEGLTDTHYGNNVQLMPGSYTVAVNIEGERASFNITIQPM